jgi:predicted RNA-binding Zn-ribbon protein involved in translation (DUF1610 family)
MSVSALNELRSACPYCGEEVVLRGARLRVWLQRAAQNPTRTGPYCNYVCSSRTNIQLAVNRRSRNTEKVFI